MSSFASAWPVVRAASQAFRPPVRVSVSQGAAERLHIVQPGGYTGRWSAAETPYMVEPMDALASRRHEAVVFVGPARSGKTMSLTDGWMAYAVTCDPGDMLILQMTQDKARDYSKTRVDRAIRHSPALAELIAGGQDDNTYDKLFRHGMWLKLGWPSASQLASSDYRYVALTDYDRMPDNIDGEGSAFQLGLKRTTTFLSRGMCMVESSPGRPVRDPNWRAATPHEAPPTTGILEVYNRGDRRRFYWPCPHCREFFEASPGLALFATLPDEEALLEVVRGADLSALASEHALIYCPHCGSAVGPEHKHRLLQAGAWLRDGEQISRDGERSGDPLSSSIASYWLGGVAAAYQSWHSLLLRYLQALRGFAASGDEETLKTVVNTDLAMPYLSALSRHDAARSDIADMAEGFPRFVVPGQARFITVSVDVQGGQDSRFVIQAHAHAPDYEQWVIDRRDIRDSNRAGSRDSGFAQVDPARYPEDWSVLTEMLEWTYRTEDAEQELRVAEIIVDTGGEEGVTANAYAWWLSLPHELRRRAWLYKGGSSRDAAPVKESTVTAQGKTGRSGTVRLLVCNANSLKDAMFNGARRAEAGPGKIHFGSWLGANFWDEMRAEVRQANGSWVKVRARNEAIDLCAMTRALLMHMHTRRVNRLSWANPPKWADRLEANTLRETRAERRARQTARPAAGRKLGKSDWSGRL